MPHVCLVSVELGDNHESRLVMENTKPRHSLFGPVLLIGAGILLLLNNFGILQLDLWEILFRFWPVLLIAIGLDVLLGRRSGIGALIAILVLVVILVGSFAWVDGTPLVADSPDARPISRSLEGAERAEVTLAASVGRLAISSLPPGAQLIEGTIIPLTNERITEDFRGEGDVAHYTLRSEGLGFTFPGWGRQNRGRWDLRLSQAIPLALSISNGVGEAMLDLERLHLTALTIDTGVGETTVTLPEQGDFQGTINGGVGELTIEIPSSLAVRINADAGIGSVDVQGDFTENGDIYTSATYADAEEQVELEVDGGVGSITIRQIKKQ
jgi:hypothetical protein